MFALFLMFFGHFLACDFGFALCVGSPEPEWFLLSKSLLASALEFPRSLSQASWEVSGGSREAPQSNLGTVQVVGEAPGNPRGAKVASKNCQNGA